MTRIPSICEWAWWIFMVRLQPSINRLRNYFSPLLLVIGSLRRFPILTLGRHEEARRNSNLFCVIDTIWLRFIKYLLRRVWVTNCEIIPLSIGVWLKNASNEAFCKLICVWLSVNAWIRLNIRHWILMLSCRGAKELVTLIWSSLHGMLNSGCSTSRSFANWTRCSLYNRPPTENAARSQKPDNVVRRRVSLMPWPQNL